MCRNYSQYPTTIGIKIRVTTFIFASLSANLSQNGALIPLLLPSVFSLRHTSTDLRWNGILKVCQTPTNPYNGNLYEQSKALSTFVLDELVASTGCTKEYVWETDTMAGINWAQVPVTIVEVGYMSNPEEDLLMATDDYQNRICRGITNGIEKFLYNK